MILPGFLWPAEARVVRHMFPGEVIKSIPPAANSVGACVSIVVKFQDE